MIPHVCVGDVVKWSTSRKPLGIVIQRFRHKEKEYAVVENELIGLKVVRVYEKLEVVDASR